MSNSEKEKEPKDDVDDTDSSEDSYEEEEKDSNEKDKKEKEGRRRKAWKTVPQVEGSVRSIKHILRKENYSRTGKSKSIRFALPEYESSGSEESLTMSSTELARIRERKFAVFSKELTIPNLPHNEPRNLTEKPQIDTQREEFEFLMEFSLAKLICLSSVSAARNKFEITRHSKNPQPEDIKLINCTYLRRFEDVQDAISSGANINTFRDRQTPLIIATEMQNVQLVEYFLSVPDININFQNSFGQTSLLLAVNTLNHRVIKMLLNHNADVNLADNFGTTPLHIALFKENIPIVNLLLAYGADYEKVDIYGQKPMYTAAVQSPNLDCLNLLIVAGASAEYYHRSGATLLMRTILSMPNFLIIKTLVESGACVNSREISTGRTPLHYAVMIDNLKIVKFLISHGADPTVKSIYNMTPYHEAVIHRHLSIAEYLLGGPVNFKTLSTINFIRN